MRMSESGQVQTAGSAAASKKAAIRLAGVSAADRKWILDRLPPTESARVRKAFEQLKAMLGDRPLDFEMFLADQETGFLEQTLSDRGELLINRLPYAAVRQVVDGLSPAYVVALLTSELWLHNSEYLQDCSAGRRAKLASVGVRGMAVHAAQSLASAVGQLAAEHSG